MLLVFTQSQDKVFHHAKIHLRDANLYVYGVRHLTLAAPTIETRTIARAMGYMHFAILEHSLVVQCPELFSRTSFLGRFCGSTRRILMPVRLVQPRRRRVGQPITLGRTLDNTTNDLANSSLVVPANIYPLPISQHCSDAWDEAST